MSCIWHAYTQVTVVSLGRESGDNFNTIATCTFIIMYNYRNRYSHLYCECIIYCDLRHL